VIEKQRGGGGTELLPALKHALALPRAQECARSVVIATDGYVTVESEAFDLIRQRLGEANMFAFGIGSSVNRHLIEGMARAGMGEPFVITKAEEAKAEAEKFRRYIESPVLAQIKIDYGEFKTYAVEPPSAPDVLAERPVIVFGKWRGAPRSSLDNNTKENRGKITLSGRTGGERYLASINVSDAKPLAANAALRYLWARHRIAVLSDYSVLKPGDEVVSEVTNLGLKYNLLTAYTSFVAVDSKVRRDGGEVTRIEQPLPMPQGVSDYAVGGLQSVAAAGSGGVLYRASNAPAQAQEMLMKPATLKVERDEAAAPRENAKLAKIVVSGGVSRAAVQSVAKKNIKEIQLCYQQAAQKQTGIQGKLVIKLAIGANGLVTQVRLVAHPFNGQAAVACLTQKLTQWRFANVRTPGEATITYELAP
jgi:Ca-activated chloride channel family protein